MLTTLASSGSAERSLATAQILCVRVATASTADHAQSQKHVRGTSVSTTRAQASRAQHARASVVTSAACAPGADEQGAGPRRWGAPPRPPRPPQPAGRRTHAAAGPSAVCNQAESAMPLKSSVEGITTRMSVSKRRAQATIQAKDCVGVKIKMYWGLACLHFALRDELDRQLQRRVAPLHLRLTRQEAGQRLGLLAHLPRQTLYA